MILKDTFELSKKVNADDKQKTMIKSY